METQTFSKEEKEEIIRYGLDRIKSICTMTFVTLLMGCIFQVFFQSIIFLVCFIALRKYAGGYHADTQNRCYVISTAIIAVALLAIRYMSDGSDNEIFILLQSLNFILLYFLVPVDNKNHRLEYWEKEKYSSRCVNKYLTYDYLDEKEMEQMFDDLKLPSDKYFETCAREGKMVSVMRKND